MLSIGDSKVSKLYLGDTEIKKAYFGNTQVFTKKSASILPDGYVQVEYIRFDGDKTSFTLQENIKCNTDKIEYKFLPETYGDNKYIFNFYSMIDNSYYFILFSTYGQNGLSYQINGLGYPNVKTIRIEYLNKLLEFNLDFVNNKYTVNGKTLVGNANENSIGEILKDIGCAHLSSSVSSLNGKYYYLKHYRNGEPIHKYLPCINPDKVAGIFDVYSQTFIQNTNPSATTITAGPAV